MRYIPIITPECVIGRVEAEAIPTLKFLQNLVGGYIETVKPGFEEMNKHIGIVNEEDDIAFQTAVYVCKYAEQLKSLARQMSEAE